MKYIAILFLSIFLCGCRNLTQRFDVSTETPYKQLVNQKYTLAKDSFLVEMNDQKKCLLTDRPSIGLLNQSAKLSKGQILTICEIYKHIEDLSYLAPNITTQIVVKIEGYDDAYIWIDERWINKLVIKDIDSYTRFGRIYSSLTYNCNYKNIEKNIFSSDYLYLNNLRKNADR